MENLDNVEEVTETDLHDDLQDKLCAIRESLNGRFMQIVVVTRDGDVMSAATADIDEPDEELSQMVSSIFAAGVHAATLLPTKYVN